jgi:hypothetical protein
MVQAPAVLAEGAGTIRVTGVYPVVQGSMEDFDRVFDALMGALMLDETISSPDLGLDLANGLLQVEFLVETDNAWQASQISSEAMARAFAAARIEGSESTEHFAHKHLLGEDPSSLELLLVGATV